MKLIYRTDLVWAKYNTTIWVLLPPFFTLTG